MSDTKTKGIKLKNGHIIKPVILDCCLGTTGEGPPGFFGLTNYNNLIDRKNSTTVLKSITRYPKEGNFGAPFFSKNGWAFSKYTIPFTKIKIPLPKKFCYFSMFGITINSFGLTNQGIDDFFKPGGDWDRIVEIGKPVIISVFIEFGKATPNDIMKAKRNAWDIMKQIRKKCDDKLLIAVVFNASCPNVTDGVCSTSDAIVECAITMKTAVPHIPLGVKLSYVQPVELGARLYNEAKIDFIQAINTIPYNVLYPDRISPLSHIGGGGISGPEIAKFALEYVTKLRKLVPDAKIIGGGGISSISDARDRQEITDSIAIGVLVNQDTKTANRIIDYLSLK